MRHEGFSLENQTGGIQIQSLLQKADLNNFKKAGSRATFLYLLKTAQDLTHGEDTLSSEDAAGTFPSYVLNNSVSVTQQ